MSKFSKKHNKNEIVSYLLDNVEYKILAFYRILKKKH